MSHPCWCLSQLRNGIHDCAVCSTLARGFTGLPTIDFPTDGEITSMNKDLKEGRGLDEIQRFKLLTDRFTIDSELPKSFRTRRGPIPLWTEDEINEWKCFLRNSQQEHCFMNYRMIKHIFPQELPLPGGSKLRIDENGQFSIDEVNLPCPLPISDLALWLTSSDRVGWIRDWKKFLFAMSSSVRLFHPQNDIEWNKWFRMNAWNGFNPSHRIIEGAEHSEWSSITHPCVKWMAMIREDQIGLTNREEQHFLLGDIERLSQEGGNACDEWLDISVSKNRGIERLLRQVVTPKLVVIEGHLCILVLKDGRPSPIRLPTDPHLWRLLISWTLAPPDSHGQKMMSRLFWCWNSPEERWRLSSSEKTSAIWLRQTVESLDTNSSMSPLQINSEKKGIWVKGTSGLYYVLLNTAEPKKFSVYAVPEKESLSSVSDIGLNLCIDSIANNDIPCGDIAASYLLALHNDEVSKRSIFTLEHLLSIYDSVPRGRKKNQPSKIWWEGIIEQYHEDHDEEWVDDEWDDEEWEEEEEEEEEAGLAINEDVVIPEEVWQQLQENHDIRMLLQAHFNQNQAEEVA